MGSSRQPQLPHHAEPVASLRTDLAAALGESFAQVQPLPSNHLPHPFAVRSGPGSHAPGHGAPTDDPLALLDADRAAGSRVARELTQGFGRKFTASLDIFNLASGPYTVQWQIVMAAVLMATVIMFGSVQRFFVEGFTAGAIC